MLSFLLAGIEGLFPPYRSGVGTATITSPITTGGGPLRRGSDVRFGPIADIAAINCNRPTNQLSRKAVSMRRSGKSHIMATTAEIRIETQGTTNARAIAAA